MGIKVILDITFSIICVAIAIMDIQKQTIYNEAVAVLLVPAIVSFFVCSEVDGVSRMFGAVSVSGLMLMICVLMPGAFGGGDIKFMVPVGLFLGLEKTVAAWVLSVFLGALWVVAEVLLRWWNTQNREGHKATCRKAVENLREMTFPFGPALCIGSIATLWWG